MIQNLYINGDSHTAGTYHERDNHDLCFSGVLAKRHNLTAINHARAGGSNPRIIRTSKEYLADKDPNDTAVLIGWSETSRAEWFVNGKWYQVAEEHGYEIRDDKFLNETWKKYRESVWNRECDYVMLNRAIEQQYQILEFSRWLSHRGFRHLFLHANTSFFYRRSPFEIVWPKDVWINDQPYNGTLSFCFQSMERGYQMDGQRHFNYDAHKEYADFIDKWFSRMLHV